MKVYQLIEKLKKMPQNNDVKVDVGGILDRVDIVEYEEARDYVIIRTK